MEGSAIFEYVHGKLVIHHGKEYQVMTNSPIYDQQIAINEYWKASFYRFELEMLSLFSCDRKSQAISLHGFGGG